MKAKIKASELSEILNKFQSLTQKFKDDSVFVLGLFRFENNQCTICVHTGTSKAMATVPAQTEVEGEILVNINLLASLLSTFRGEVEFISTENSLKIVQDNTSVTVPLSTAKCDLSPFMMPDINQIQLEGAALRTIFKKLVKFTFETDDNLLSGINIKSQEGILLFTGCNTIKMGLMELKHTLDTDINIILPKTATQFITQFTDAEKINLAIENNRCFFKFNNIIFSTNLIAGKYPDAQRIIPAQRDTKFTLDKQILINILKRIEILNKSHALKVIFNIEGFMLTITDHLGRVKEMVTLDNSIADKKFMLDPRLLQTLLSAMDNNNINFEVTDSLVIFPENANKFVLAQMK